MDDLFIHSWCFRYTEYVIRAHTCEEKLLDATCCRLRIRFKLLRSIALRSEDASRSSCPSCNAETATDGMDDKFMELLGKQPTAPDDIACTSSLVFESRKSFVKEETSKLSVHDKQWNVALQMSSLSTLDY